MDRSQAVRELRLALGLTQEQFARHVGVTLRTIARYENEVPPAGPLLYLLADLAEQQELSEPLHVFQEAISRELNDETGAGRLALRGLLRKHFVGVLEGLQEVLDKRSARVTESEASSLLNSIRRQLDWAQLRALKQLVESLEEISSQTNPILSVTDPVAKLEEITRSIQHARQMLDARLPFNYGGKSSKE